MKDDAFDVIVIGAGMGGLCCAGELVLQGARPLLISESKEVGAALRARMVAGNRGIVQMPTYQIGWGGGWWPSLVRRLNVPIRIPLGFGPIGYDLAMYGDPQVRSIPPHSISAASLTSLICEMLPMVGDAVGELDAIFHKVLAIPYEELAKMHDVPLMQWLEDQKADELVAQIVVTLVSSCLTSTGDFVRKYASVYGAFADLRSLFCGEAIFGLPYPDAQEGLAVPLAKGIEHHGGTVWRGRRVAEVRTDAGRVGSVVMEDGSEVRAPMVAIACGNSRIAALLDHVPPEAEPALAYSEQIAHQDFHVFAVLDKPVVPPESKRFVGVLDADGSVVQYFGPLHAVAPWLAQPEKQFVVAGTAYPAGEVGRHGGEEAIYARLHENIECYYPGYNDAIGTSASFGHKPGHLWFTQHTIGPKLPRRVESVEGLWFVGEGSTPTYGVWMEAVASAGILGARAMAASRNAE